MDQIEIFDIVSPCRRICQTDSRGYCLGCYRSREERFNWFNYDNAEKRRVITLCKNRKATRQRALLKQEKSDLEIKIDVQLDLGFVE